MTSNSLDDVLENMRLGIPAVYDFQGRDMSFEEVAIQKDKYGSRIVFDKEIFTVNGEGKTLDVVWRNGSIMLSTYMRLWVASAGVVFERLKIVGGGGLVLKDGADLTLAACEINDSHANGLSLSGNSLVTATNLRIIRSQEACICMTDHSTINVTDCEMIPGGDFPTGVDMSDNSRLIGTRVRISETYIGFRMRGEPTLLLTDSTVGQSRESYVLGKSSLEMTRCVLKDDLSASQQSTASICLRECSTDQLIF